MSNLPDLLRKARLVHGMSQRDLAKALGVHHAAVGAWEVGANQPDVANKIALAQVLQIRFADLMPEISDQVVLVTDRDLVAIVRLIERETPDRRAAMLRAIALLLEPQSRPAASDSPARKRRSAPAG
jgi:transcriptional regulator with XRE-family HTH domain